MRRLTATLCLTLAVLLFSATQGFALPPCPTDRHVSTWTDCFGTYTSAKGDKYVGEFRDGKYHGQGTETFGGGKYVGEYKDGKRWEGTKYDKDGNVTFTYSEGVGKCVN